MSPSLEFLERCSADTGFAISALEKVTRLGELASAIGRHALLARTLVLKGGTALNLGFGPPRRLSVDLDFNYIGAVERERMLAERPPVESAAAELSRRMGYRIQQSADAFAGRKLFLHYRSVLGPEERIEIDVNFLLRVPLSPVEARELWQPDDLERPRVDCVSIDELLVGKLCALLDRCAVRDAWDVANLPPQVAAVLGDRGFRGRFLALAGTLDHSPASYDRARFVERLTQAAVDRELGPLLTRGSATRAADLVAAAWCTVAPLLLLTDRERAFIDRLQSGEVRVDLLFPESAEEALRLSRHPALVWKARNALAHRALGASARPDERTEDDADT